MDPLMVPMMESFKGYCIEIHWDILTIKCMALMKTSNRDVPMIKLFALYLEVYMESCLGLMFEHSWDL